MASAQASPLGPLDRLQSLAWLFPLAIILTIPTFCIGFYAISLFYDQLDPFFPFVSDAGASLPQAPFFSTILDLLALLVLASALSRYRQIRAYITRHFAFLNETESDSLSRSRRLHRLNNLSLWLACLASLSLILVGNFRTTEEHRIHVSAAFTMIALKLAYFALQTYLSFRLNALFSIESPPKSLLGFTVFGFITFSVCFTAGLVSIFQFGQQKFLLDNYARLHWSWKDPGFVAHVMGTISEWLTLNLFSLLYGCLCRRMRAFERSSKV